MIAPATTTTTELNPADTFDPTTCVWVLTEEELDYLHESLRAADEIVVDLETTGLQEWAWSGGALNGGVPARIVLASFTLPGAADTATGTPATWVFPLSHPESPWSGRWRTIARQVFQGVRDSGRPLVNQNVKFDARWVYRHTGVDLSHQIMWDTQVSSHLIDENQSTRLKVRAPATFGIQRWDDFDLATPAAAERVPLFDLGMYAARDTYWTWRLAALHRDRLFVGTSEGPTPGDPDEIEDARLGRLATWCAMPMVASLTAIEQRGMRLDRGWVHAELARYHDRAGELITSLAERYGMDPATASFAPTSNWFAAWTEEAVRAGDLRIAELTPTGRPRWSKGVLVRQARLGSEVAEQILELRGATKRTEYLGSWIKHASRDDLVHATYWAGKVLTGRLSSSDPNMQQVTAALKPAFIPRPGHCFVDLDYSQIELRVAAFVSRCEPMLQALRRGDDLHRILAAKITGKAFTDITPEERHGGKSANFGLLYSMSPGGFQEYADTVYGVLFTAEEAYAVHQAFFETWEGMAQWHARCIRQVNRTGQITSPIGRVRRLPDIWSPHDALSSLAERQAINSPVQGLASDMMQMAAASIEGTLPGYQAVPYAEVVATVHDNIVVETPIDGWETVAIACQERMTSIGEVLTRLDCDLDVPLVAAAKVGTRWGWSDLGELS